MNTNSPDWRDGYAFGRAEAAAFPDEDALDATFTPKGVIKGIIGSCYAMLYGCVLLGSVALTIYFLITGELTF